MGIDINELWGNIQNSVDQAFTDVKNVGVPALQASLEQWGIDTLTKQHENTMKTVDENVRELLGRPTEPGSMGSYIANTLQTPILKEYGGLMVAGVATIAILAVLIFRK